MNGLPLVVVELKNAASENATIEDAFNQLQTYKAQIPSLFRTNAALVTSDGLLARVGSLSAGEDRFMPWRTVTGAHDDFTPEGPKEMDTLLRGMMQPERLLQLVRDFTVFGDKGDGVFKIIAGYHQFHGARKALASAIDAVSAEGNRKVGVIWHTQGVGQELFDGVLCWASGASAGTAKPDNPCCDGPKRSGRPALWDVFALPRPDPSDPRTKSPTVTTCATSWIGNRGA